MLFKFGVIIILIECISVIVCSNNTYAAIKLQQNSWFIFPYINVNTINVIFSYWESTAFKPKKCRMNISRHSTWRCSRHWRGLLVRNPFLFLFGVKAAHCDCFVFQTLRKWQTTLLRYAVIMTSERDVIL